MRQVIRSGFDFDNVAKRLQSLKRTSADIARRKAAVLAEEAAFTRQLETLLSVSNDSSVATPTKRRGRKPGSKNKTVKAPKVSATPKRRAGGLITALRQVLPGSTEAGINKDEIVSRLTQLGWKSASKDPKIVIGAALSKENDFVAEKRGQWRLSKTGENRRDKDSANQAPVVDAPPVAPAIPVEAEADVPVEQTA